MIIDQLNKYYETMVRSGYIPTTVGVSDEEYAEYQQLLKDITDLSGFVWIDKPTKLTFKGMELKKYGKRHKDSNRK